MNICEHEKNIDRLVREFGNSCSKNEIKGWYNLKREKSENDRAVLPYTGHVMTYMLLREDLAFSFPDNVPKKEFYNLIKSYKNDVNF